MTRLFMSGTGIDLADRLAPLIDANIPSDCGPVDVINGIAISLTRRLGHLERAGEPLLTEWVKQYSIFMLGRFASLNEADIADKDQTDQLPVLCRTDND